MPRDSKKKRRTRKRGGSSEGTHTSTTKSLPYTQYAMPDGASSHREAALSRTTTMNNNQQNMINTHGGRKRATKNARKRKTVRRKSIFKKLKVMRRKSKSRRSNKKSKGTGRKIKKHTRVRSKSTKRRGKKGGGSDSGQPVTVPSFANSGSSVSGINANSMSQSSNSTSLNANSQAGNDCYATGTCKQSGGFRNHYEVFGGLFGKGMTGGLRSRKRRAGSKSSGCGCTSGGKGVRDYNDKNTNPNRQDAHGSGGLIERMFGN